MLLGDALAITEVGLIFISTMASALVGLLAPWAWKKSTKGSENRVDLMLRGLLFLFFLAFITGVAILFVTGLYTITGGT